MTKICWYKSKRFSSNAMNLFFRRFLNDSLLLCLVHSLKAVCIPSLMQCVQSSVAFNAIDLHSTFLYFSLSTIIIIITLFIH